MPNKPTSALYAALGRIPQEGYTGQIHSEIERLWRGAEALAALHATPTPTQSPEDHRRSVADSGKNFQNEVIAARYRIQAYAKTALDDVAGRIELKVRLIPDQSAPAIRTAFRNMNSTDQEKLLTELIDGNRSSELAALTECPALMSGLPEEMQSKYRKAIIAKHAPSELVERRIILEALNDAVVAADIAGKFAKHAARGRPA